MTKLIAIIPIIFTTLACSQHEGSHAGEDIAALSDSWEAALKEGDLDRLAELYATDTTLLPPNGAAKRGRDAVRESFGGMVAAGLTLDLNSIEARTSGDIGYNVGTYTMHGADGGTVDEGKFVEVWRQSAGSWQIAYDTWNSDRPPAPPTGDETHVMVLHEVEDADVWMAAWRGEDSRRRLFKEHGVAHVHAFHSPQKPDLTGLVVSVSDMDAFQAMLDSEEGQAAAAEDGVKIDTIVMMSEVE